MSSNTPHSHENITSLKINDVAWMEFIASNDKVDFRKSCSKETWNIIHNDPIYGIDTIKVGFHVMAEEMTYEGWQKFERTNQMHEEEFLINVYYLRFISMPNGAQITLKFIPYDYSKSPLNLLLIEFSFPKLVLGNNYKNIHDWGSALNIANEEIANISGLPHLPDIQDGVLYRLDICANLQVGTFDLNDYLQVLTKCKHPHRKTQSYTGQGAVFAAREKRTIFYNKYEESKEKEAKGILRLEIQLLKKRAIGEWTKSKRPTLRQITLRMIVRRLLDELQILKLNLPMICDELEIAHVLSQMYSSRQVRSMLGYWVYKRTLTREQMISRGYTSRTICHFEMLFTKAGVSSNSIDSSKTLPALSKFFQDIDKICNKPLSDTRVIHTISSNGGKNG